MANIKQIHRWPYIPGYFVLGGYIWVLTCGPATAASTADYADNQESIRSLKSLSIEQLMDIPVVYGASKHEQKVTEAPSSISVINADQIKKFGYRTLADALRSVRGLYTRYDRNYGYLGVRGMNRPGDWGGRILLLLDGHRMNDPITDGAGILTDFILDIDLVDRIEVIRGPGSSLYGNNAFFAVINVVSRRGRDLQGLEIMGRTASYGTYEGRTSYGKRFDNGLEMLLSGSYLDSGGHRQLSFDNLLDHTQLTALKLDGDSDYRLYGSLAYGDFSIQTAYNHREKAIPTATQGTIFNDRRTRTIDDRLIAELNYHHKFANELETKARLYYDWSRNNGYYPYASVDDNGSGINILNKDNLVASWWGSELQISKRLFDKHLLTLGGEYRGKFDVTVQNFDIEPRFLNANTHGSPQFYSFYGQDEYTLLPNLTINAGFRYDHFSTFGDTFNPRAAVIYSPWEKTILKLLYGTAFRAPNVYETNYSNPTFKTNPHIQPEKIHSYEAVLEQYLPYNFHFSLSGFYNQINDLIGVRTDQTDNKDFYTNIDNIDTYGMDFEIESKTESGWLGRLSYTLQHSRKNTMDLNGEKLTNSPAHLVKFNMVAPLYGDKLFSGIEIQYTSRVHTFNGNIINSYWLANMYFFSQKILPGLELSAGIFNLFDHRYSQPAGPEHCGDENSNRICIDTIPQDGRTFQLKLRYHF